MLLLHILFLLLKIIGCVLLTLLCLILLVVLIVLLVPVRYRVSAQKYTGFAAEAEASWLLRLLGFFIRIDMKEEEGKRVHLHLRVAWFTLYDNLHPRRKRIKKKGISKTKNTASHSEPVDDRPASSVTADNVNENKEPLRITEDKDKSDKLKSGGNDEGPEKVYSEGNDVEPEEVKEIGKVDWIERIKSVLEKIAGVCKGILHIPSAIVQRCQRLKKKIDGLLEKKNKILEIYHDEKNHRWLMRVLGRLKKLGLRMLPRIDRLLWHFGFGDPATTGQVLGFLSIFYPVCQERMVLRPEFDREVMEGEIKLHGRIQLLPIAVFMIRSFLNKQFFTIVKQVKNI